MKALTICQPYAHLIALPDTDPLRKRVENRTWPAPRSLRQQRLVIHAGKSRQWLNLGDEDQFPNMTFGAAVATARVAGCLTPNEIQNGHLKNGSGNIDKAFPWLREHVHVQGPYCWILVEVRALPKPIPYRGAQGLFDFPDNLLPEGFRA